MITDREFNEGFWVGVVITFVSMAAVVILAYCSTRNTYKQQAIERGFAEYDQETGEWQWKDDEK